MTIYNHWMVFADDIIKRRLLLEGDGGVDDRRINNTLKMFIKWCNANESPEERYEMYTILYLATLVDAIQSSNVCHRLSVHVPTPLRPRTLDLS